MNYGASQSSMRTQLRELRSGGNVKYLLVALLVVICVTGCSSSSEHHEEVVIQPNSEQEPCILSFETDEEPRVQTLPTGTMVYRFDNPLPISSGYYMAVLYHSDPKDIDGEILLYKEGETASLEESGAYSVYLFLRKDGKIDPAIAHVFLVVIEPWPEPFFPEIKRKLPEDAFTT